MATTPTLEYEQAFWQQGIGLIAGIDEVGMGALAGPVVAAAVILKQDIAPESLAGIRDSKKLSAAQREKLDSVIKNSAHAWAIGEASVDEITKINIRRAAHLAMQRAVDQLQSLPELLLIDGNPAQPHPTIPATNIIKGDSLSLSIASASIIAKVYRDAIMTQLDAAFPIYGFAGHKGYGSPTHLAALQEYGPCAHHRATYAPIASLLAKARKQVSQ